MTATGERVWGSLTEREREIVRVICTESGGFKELSSILNCAEGTLKNMLRYIYAKAGQSSRVELMFFAFHHGMVPCPCAARYAEAGHTGGVE